MSTVSVLSVDATRRALAVRDLTDPGRGPHAMQQLVEAAAAALAARWRCDVVLHRANPVIPIEDNYDRLGYSAEAAARDARYTRYLSERLVLRTHTSAMIPPLLDQVAAAAGPADVLLVCPGMVYRRDAIDRLHTGEPHQLDLWRVRRGAPPLGEADLDQMIAVVIEALLPGRHPVTQPAQHPYTLAGRQIDVDAGHGPIEVGECGLAHPAILTAAGLDPARGASGLAMGLGLDRLVMLRKQVDDIRLLRSPDPRVSRQMLDLAPYVPVSDQPAIRRDLSIAVDADATVEDLGDAVRSALADDARIEAIEVAAETAYADLPEVARARLGIAPDQKNVLLRIVLRDLSRTLTHAEANELRDRVYVAVHRGTRHEWASGPPVTTTRT